MKDRSLEALWKASGGEADLALDGPALVTSLESRVAWSTRMHLAKDLVEVACALFVIPVLFFAARPASRLFDMGAWIASAGFALVAGLITLSAIRRRARPLRLGVRAQLEEERREVLHRIRAWNTAWAWFYAPLVVGFDLMVAAMPGLPEPLRWTALIGMPLYAAFLAIGIGRAVVQTKLEPMARELDRLLAEVTGG